MPPISNASRAVASSSPRHGPEQAHPAATALSPETVAQVLDDFGKNMEARLIQSFTRAFDQPLNGLAVHHLFLGSFLACMDEAFLRSGVDLRKQTPANLDHVLRTAFNTMMNDPVLGRAKQAQTRLRPNDFFPDANVTLKFMHDGFRRTSMDVIPKQHLWRLCVNQNRVAQLSKVGIDMADSPLAPFLTDGEPRFCQSVLKALHFGMENQHKPVDLNFIKNLHKRLNAAGSSNMAEPAKGSGNVNANVNALNSSKEAEFDTMFETGFNLVVDPSCRVRCAEEIREFEKDVRINLPRFRADEGKMGGQQIFNITRPFCSPRTLEKIINRWIGDYHQKMEKDPDDGVRHAVVLCQNIGRLHGFQNGNGRLSHVLLNHLLAQQQAVRPVPELAASNGMASLSFKSILCSSCDEMTASVKQAQKNFALLCRQDNAGSKNPPMRKVSPLQQAYLVNKMQGLDMSRP